MDRALIEYAAASYHFEEAEHRCYRANVENNLGFLYYKISRCREAHEHLDKARRVLSSLKDKISIADVDETRARVFLKERRYAEAEQVALLAVRAFDRGQSHSKLAEALITHGKALARLGSYVPSLAAFRRAITLSEETGNASRISEAAVAVFQELGDHIAVSEGHDLVSGLTFTEAIEALERKYIKRALDSAQGSVTYAAQSLGIPHQSLNYMLHTRHKDLLKERTPARPRKRRQ